MNSEYKIKWIDALRSGRYKQGAGYLRCAEDTFCCLGVLADVLGVEWKRSEFDYYFKLPSGNDYYWAVLPNSKLPLQDQLKLWLGVH